MKEKGEGRAIRQFSCCSYWAGKSLGEASLLVTLSVVLKIPDKSNIREGGLTSVYSVLNPPRWEGHCSRSACHTACTLQSRALLVFSCLVQKPSIGDTVVLI